MSAILGVLFATLIGMIMIPTFMHFEHEGIENARIATTAQQLKQISNAAQAYIEANHTAIESVATASSPANISIAMLQSSGYLSPALSTENPYSQTWNVQVLQPSPGSLQALVLSSGGTLIDEKTAPLISAQVGSEGGFVPYPGQYGSLDPSVAQGAHGGWHLSLSGYSNPGQGHLASLLFFNNGNLANNYLYRNAVPGHPELNAMQTDLSMTDAGGAKHNITGADVISTNSLNALSNGTKAVPSVVMANGAVVAWNEIGSGAVLGLKSTTGQSVYVQSANGSFQLANDAQNKTLMSVDQNGNVVAASSFQLQNGASFNSDQGGSMELGGNSGAPGTGTPYIDFHLAGVGAQDYNTRLINDSNNNISVQSANNAASLTVQGQVNVGTAGGTAVPRQGCSPNGAMASNSDGSGQILSCQNGLWYPVGGHWLRIGYYVVSNGSQVYPPACPSGGTPSIVVTPQSFKVNPTAAVSYGAIDNGAGNPWTVYIQDGSGAGIDGAQAIASTYCSY